MPASARRHLNISLRTTLAATAAVASLASCASPVERERQETLRRSIVESAQRELAAAAESPGRDKVTRDERELPIPPERIKELRELGGPGAYGQVDPPLGKNLLGEETQLVAIALERVIASAVENNLDAQLARIDSAVSQTDVVAAEAVFDWVFFAGVDIERRETETVVPAVQGVPIGSAINKNRAYAFETGIRRELTSGGSLEIRSSLDIFNNQSPGISRVPDPSRDALLEITLDQPLLRGFGADVALADVRLARNVDRRGVQQLRQTLLDVVTEAERAYWALEAAFNELLIRQRLLNLGVETREVLRGRLDFDVRPAEFSDAVARVESRRGDVIRAANQFRQQSDRLKALVNDPRYTVGDETVLLPTDDAIDEAIAFSLYDAIATALAGRPEIQQAILGIDDAAIRERVADNGRLPLLNLRFQTQFTGLDEDASEAFQDLVEEDFVNFLFGVTFEQPIGNRAAEAVFRRRRLERLRAAVGYRASVQDAVLDVKTALRDIETNYRLIEQTRISRLAATENLRTLLVEEETLRGLTPEFLDLKLSRQEALAAAELAEVQALTGYNAAIADYYDATGTALRRNGVRLLVPDLWEEPNAAARANDDGDPAP